MRTKQAQYTQHKEEKLVVPKDQLLSCFIVAMDTLQSPSGNMIPFEPYIHVLLIPK